MTGENSEMKLRFEKKIISLNKNISPKKLRFNKC